jgi:stage II sporulation protein AA (anti-sigma F factor antagonist)
VDQEETVFSATAEGDADHRRVVVTGEVDMATADQMFQAVTREPANEVTLDLRAVTFFDSAAIQALVRLTDRIPHLAVIPSHRVRRVLDIAGLGDQAWLVPE